MCWFAKLGDKKIVVLNKAKDFLLLPYLARNRPVARHGRNEGFDGAAHRPFGGTLPESEIVLPKRELRVEDLAGIRRHVLHQSVKGARDVQGVERLERAASRLALHEVE